jgi:hypothetical protein
MTIENKQCTCNTFGKNHFLWCATREKSNVYSQSTKRESEFKKGEVVITCTRIEAIIADKPYWDDIRNTYVYTLTERNGNKGWALEHEITRKKILLKD